METVNDNVSMLAAAIVIQAAKDYWRVCLVEKGDEKHKALYTKKRALEKFFRSDWCYTLVGSETYDPEYYIAEIKKARRENRRIVYEFYQRESDDRPFKRSRSINGIAV